MRLPITSRSTCATARCVTYALSGKSIVADSSVQGTITLDLKKVPFDTALRIITSAKGLNYRLTDGVILVGSSASLEKFNDTASVIRLNYANAEEIKPALASLIGAGSKISTDCVTNSIIFTGTPTDEAQCHCRAGRGNAAGNAGSKNYSRQPRGQ